MLELMNKLRIKEHEFFSHKFTTVDDELVLIHGMADGEDIKRSLDGRWTTHLYFKDIVFPNKPLSELDEPTDIIMGEILNRTIHEKLYTPIKDRHGEIYNIDYVSTRGLSHSEIIEFIEYEHNTLPSDERRILGKNYSIRYVLNDESGTMIRYASPVITEIDGIIYTERSMCTKNIMIYGGPVLDPTPRIETFSVAIKGRCNQFSTQMNMIYNAYLNRYHKN
jgi:hypothetical protein